MDSAELILVAWTTLLVSAPVWLVAIGHLRGRRRFRAQAAHRHPRPVPGVPRDVGRAYLQGLAAARWTKARSVADLAAQLATRHRMPVDVATEAPEAFRIKRLAWPGEPAAPAVCAYERGILSAAFLASLGTRVEVTESRCRASGDAACVFDIGLVRSRGRLQRVAALLRLPLRPLRRLPQRRLPQASAKR